MKLYQYRETFVNARPQLFELTVLIVVLDSQGHDSESDDGNDSNPYFTEISFHLRKITEAPVETGDNAKLVSKSRAEVMQKHLDEQVLRLTSSDHMLKFLRRQNKDLLPCKRSNRHHVRRLVQILLHELEIEGRICETEHSEDTVIFEILEGTQQPLVAAPAAVESLSSQLSFQSGMAMPRQVNDVGN